MLMFYYAIPSLLGSETVIFEFSLLVGTPIIWANLLAAATTLMNETELGGASGWNDIEGIYKLNSLATNKGECTEKK